MTTTLKRNTQPRILGYHTIKSGMSSTLVWLTILGEHEVYKPTKAGRINLMTLKNHLVKQVCLLLWFG